jgi:hypothetical protein
VRGAGMHSTESARNGKGQDNGNDDEDDNKDIPFVDERARRVFNRNDDAAAANNDDNNDTTATRPWREGGRRRRNFAKLIDFRKVAPLNAGTDVFRPLPANALTVGGLHRRHRSLPWAQLVRPSHELAMGGVIVGWYLARHQIHIGIAFKYMIYFMVLFSLGRCMLVFSSLLIYYDVRDNDFCCLILECCALSCYVRISGLKVLWWLAGWCFVQLSAKLVLPGLQ